MVFVNTYPSFSIFTQTAAGEESRFAGFLPVYFLKDTQPYQEEKSCLISFKNKSEAAESIWYFFQTKAMPNSTFGFNGINRRLLFPVVLIMPSMVRALPIPASTIREAL